MACAWYVHVHGMVYAWHVRDMCMHMVCRQAKLVEVNTNGYMIGNLHKDFFALHDEQRAIMKLMGGSGYPRYAVSGGTE